MDVTTFNVLWLVFYWTLSIYTTVCLFVILDIWLFFFGIGMFVWFFYACTCPLSISFFLCVCVWSLNFFCFHGCQLWEFMSNHRAQLSGFPVKRPNTQMRKRDNTNVRFSPYEFGFAWCQTTFQKLFINQTFK